MSRVGKSPLGPAAVLTALAAGALSAGVAGCAPDQTSFLDLGDGSDSSNGSRAPVYPVMAAQDRGGGALPAGSLKDVSFGAAVDCVSALRVTQRNLSQQGGAFGAQAINAMEQAETLFHDRARGQGAEEEQSSTDLSVAIERRTQDLLQSPGEAAQQALTCIRTLSESA
jgi:hypothetical protein